MRINEPVSQKERGYPDHYHLITTTDLRGKITAAIVAVIVHEEDAGIVAVAHHGESPIDLTA